MRVLVVIKTQFEGVHYWKGCNLPEVAFLMHPHRHIFHVKMKFDVAMLDREIEFISMKRTVDKYIAEHFMEGTMTYSCEQIAMILKNEFNAAFVSVFEDKENGAEVYAN
jgi:hypothetical protein